MFSYSAARAVVTISGALAAGLPQPSSKQTIKNTYDNTSRTYTQNSWVTSVTYTVTAGKTLYITGLNCHCSSNANLAARYRLVVDGVTMLMGSANSTTTTTTTSGNQQNIISLPTPITAAATKTVTIDVMNLDTVGIFATTLFAYEA